MDQINWFILFLLVIFSINLCWSFLVKSKTDEKLTAIFETDNVALPVGVQLWWHAVAVKNCLTSDLTSKSVLFFIFHELLQCVFFYRVTEVNLHSFCYYWHYFVFIQHKDDYSIYCVDVEIITFQSWLLLKLG